MERIDTGQSDLKVQVFVLSPLSTEYESPAPSPKLTHRLFSHYERVFNGMVKERSWCCFSPS